MQLQDEVFPILAADFPQVVKVWEASVRATHRFVNEADFEIFRPLVQNALPLIKSLACVRDNSGQVAGFVAVVNETRLVGLLIK